MKKEETNINSRKHSATVQRASRSLYLMPHTLYLNFIFYILYLILGSSCHYPRPDLEDGKLGAKTRDSLTYLYERHYTWNTNLEVQEDSVTIACLPVKDCYNTLYKGDRVVVAEFAIHRRTVWTAYGSSSPILRKCRLASGKGHDPGVCTYGQYLAGHLPVQRYACFLFHCYFCAVCGSMAVSRVPAEAVANGLLQ